MKEINETLDLSEILASINQQNEEVKEMVTTRSVLRGTPKFSENEPTLSPSRRPHSDINSPISLEALKACNAASRMSVFTPPPSPSKTNAAKSSPHSPYSLIGPS